MKKIYSVLIFSILSICNIYAQIFTQKDDFPGGLRQSPIFFSIGDKIYVGGGLDTTIFKSDLWEYNTAMDIWTKKKDLPTTLTLTSSANLNGQIYLGLGWDSGKSLSSWWLYDSANDNWIKKADFPGKPRYGAACYSWNNEIYILGGGDYDTANMKWVSYNETWKYNPAADNWQQLDSFPYKTRVAGFTPFVVGNTLYYGFGQNDELGEWYSDFYSYDLVNKIWKNLAEIPITPSLPAGSATFAGNYGNKIILFNTDWNAEEPDDFDNMYVYDIIKNEWTIYNDVVPTKWRVFGFCDKNGNKGYSGLGLDYLSGEVFKDVWEVDLSTLITSIENQFPELSKIQVVSSPNKIQLELPENLKSGYSISIQSIDGKEIETFALNKETEIDLSLFQSGTYVWSILFKGSIVKSGRFIKI